MGEVSTYEAGVASGRRLEQERMAQAAAELSTTAHYQVMQELGSAHPCPAPGCRLSAEEHHRLAYGIMAENRELRRQHAPAKAAVLREAIERLARMMAGFSQEGRHTRAWWAVEMLRQWADEADGQGETAATHPAAAQGRETAGGGE